MAKTNFDIITETGKKVTVRKEATDPLCMRASLGGKKGLYYLVFRGDDLNDIEEMLTETLEAFKEAKINMQ